MSSPLRRFLARVSAATGPTRRNGTGYAARCPAHDDRTPSLAISEGDDGRVLFHCHAGCPPERVLQALSLSFADLHAEGHVSSGQRAEATAPPPPRNGAVPLHVIATYVYTSAEGEPLFRVLRLKPKSFRQQHPDGRGGWAWGRGDASPLLYRLPRIVAAARSGDTVFVVEGEKDVEALEALGLVATCSPGGPSGSGRRPNWQEALHAEPLRGARVVVLPDNDEPGRAHARAVCENLLGVARDVRVVELPGLPVKGDVSEWLAAGGNREELLTIARSTSTYNGGSRDESPTGTRRARPWLGTLVSDVEAEDVRWLWPGRLALGKLTTLDGDPGVGKSTLYCDLAASITTGPAWPEGYRPERTGVVVVVTTEDGITDTIRPRLEAAGADVTRVLVVGLIPECDAGSGDDLGRMPVLPDDVETLMGACADVGARLLVIDPLMAYLGNANSHKDQDVRAALAPLSEAAERYGVAVLVVRHLNKAAGMSALYRGGGSIGIIGGARIGLFAGRDPADPGRVVLACSKNNLAPRPPSLSFRLTPGAHGPVVARVRWEGETPLTADDLCRPGSHSAPALDRAKAWLETEMAGRSRPAKDIKEAAERAGISDHALYGAKKALNARSTRRGGIADAGVWEWTPFGVDASTPNGD